MIEYIQNNSYLIVLLIVVLVVTLEITFKRNNITKLRHLVDTLKAENEQFSIMNDTLRKANLVYYNNIDVLSKFTTFYLILTDILTSKLGAKTEGFTYRTFDYKKENGVTIEKRVSNKKVKVKGEVGYLIRDKYFIKKSDVDTLLLAIGKQVSGTIPVYNEIDKNSRTLLNNLITSINLNPSLLHIEVEEVRGNNKFVINN